MWSTGYNVVIVFMFCRIQVSNPQKSLAALGLMLTCMYAGTYEVPNIVIVKNGFSAIYRVI